MSSFPFPCMMYSGWPEAGTIRASSSGRDRACGLLAGRWHALAATMKTQGEIEAAICQGMSRFEQEYMGRGPKEIRTHLIVSSVAQRSLVCKATVPLTMIVRNEDDTVSHCLSSVAGLFDDIVMVDTNSADWRVRSPGSLGRACSISCGLMTSPTTGKPLMCFGDLATRGRMWTDITVRHTWYTEPSWPRSVANDRKPSAAGEPSSPNAQTPPRQPQS